MKKVPLVQRIYSKLSMEENLLPTASHCSKPFCVDRHCPVNREMWINIQYWMNKGWRP